MFVCDRLELDVISNVLNEVEDFNGNQCGDEEIYEDEWMLKNYSTDIVFQRYKEYVFIEVGVCCLQMYFELKRKLYVFGIGYFILFVTQFSKIDVKIMRSMVIM